MGGWGSGRQCGSECTEDYRSIDIRRWQRDGLLEPGRYFNWQWSCNGESVANINVIIEYEQIRLIYSCKSYGGEWEKLDYAVRLKTTSCHYGGVRYWFTCPAIGCGRRVALLYSGRIFACRHCYQLAYKSQRETPDYRAARRADKIRDKLDWERGILNPTGWKPKGMHWKTYYRLISKHDHYSNIALLGIAAKLHIFDARLSAIGNRIRNQQ